MAVFPDWVSEHLKSEASSARKVGQAGVKSVAACNCMVSAHVLSVLCSLHWGLHLTLESTEKSFVKIHCLLGLNSSGSSSSGRKVAPASQMPLMSVEGREGYPPPGTAPGMDCGSVITLLQQHEPSLGYWPQEHSAGSTLVQPSSQRLLLLPHSPQDQTPRAFWGGVSKRAGAPAQQSLIRLHLVSPTWSDCWVVPWDGGGDCICRNILCLGKTEKHPWGMRDRSLLSYLILTNLIEYILGERNC
jgi:hypothetical protein